MAGFSVKTLALLSDLPEPSRTLSPQCHCIGDDPLIKGLAAGHAVVLEAVSSALVNAAAIAFERREPGLAVVAGGGR